MQNLDILVEEVGGSLVVSVSGEADHVTSPLLREALVRLATMWPGRLVVDLSRLSFMDSSGLSALIAGYKQAMTTGQGLCVAGLLPHIARMFKITAIDTLIAVHQTLRDALPDALPGHRRPYDAGEEEQVRRGVPLEIYLTGHTTSP